MEPVFFVIGVFMQWTLEALGAGGAVWGMSEVWKMRGDQQDDPIGTNDNIRIPANIVFVLGFVRVFFRYMTDSNLKSAIVDPQAWVKNRGSGNDTKGALLVLEILGLLLGIYLQWDLEVLGAGGACWGMSEVWNLRNDPPNPLETNDNWRWVANTVFTIALFRMAQKYCPDHPVHTAMLGPQDWLAGVTSQAKAVDAGRTGDMEMTAVSSRKADPETGGVGF